MVFIHLVMQPKSVTITFGAMSNKCMYVAL